MREVFRQVAVGVNPQRPKRTKNGASVISGDELTNTKEDPLGPNPDKKLLCDNDTHVIYFQNFFDISG